MGLNEIKDVSCFLSKDDASIFCHIYYAKVDVSKLLHFVQCRQEVKTSTSFMPTMRSLKLFVWVGSLIDSCLLEYDIILIDVENSQQIKNFHK